MSAPMGPKYYDVTFGMNTGCVPFPARDEPHPNRRFSNQSHQSVSNGVESRADQYPTTLLEYNSELNSIIHPNYHGFRGMQPTDASTLHMDHLLEVPRSSIPLHTRDSFYGSICSNQHSHSMPQSMLPHPLQDCYLPEQSVQYFSHNRSRRYSGCCHCGRVEQRDGSSVCPCLRPSLPHEHNALNNLNKYYPANQQHFRSDPWPPTSQMQAPTSQMQGVIKPKYNQQANVTILPPRSSHKTNSHVYHRDQASAGSGKVRDYQCSYCGYRKSSSSAASDGMVRIRCVCGGSRGDGVFRMHACWKVYKEEDEDLATLKKCAAPAEKCKRPAEDMDGEETEHPNKKHRVATPNETAAAKEDCKSQETAAAETLMSVANLSKGDNLSNTL